MKLLKIAHTIFWYDYIVNCRLTKDINFNQYEYWYKVLKVITMTDYCATIETISMNNDNYLDYLSLINLILLMIPQHTLNWNMIHMN